MNYPDYCKASEDRIIACFRAYALFKIMLSNGDVPESLVPLATDIVAHYDHAQAAIYAAERAEPEAA